MNISGINAKIEKFEQKLALWDQDITAEIAQVKWGSKCGRLDKLIANAANLALICEEDAFGAYDRVSALRQNLVNLLCKSFENCQNAAQKNLTPESAKKRIAQLEKIVAIASNNIVDDPENVFETIETISIQSHGLIESLKKKLVAIPASNKEQSGTDELDDETALKLSLLMSQNLNDFVAPAAARTEESNFADLSHKEQIELAAALSLSIYADSSDAMPKAEGKNEPAIGEDLSSLSYEEQLAQVLSLSMLDSQPSAAPRAVERKNEPAIGERKRVSSAAQAAVKNEPQAEWVIYKEGAAYQMARIEGRVSVQQGGEATTLYTLASLEGERKRMVPENQVFSLGNGQLIFTRTLDDDYMQALAVLETFLEIYRVSLPENLSSALRQENVQIKSLAETFVALKAFGKEFAEAQLVADFAVMDGKDMKDHFTGILNPLVELLKAQIEEMTEDCKVLLKLA